MADGDRPIVLVPLATARKAARRAGVTLNLSADDIALAGKWKHGWIPLDAVASAVKAKRYHGGGGEGRTVKGKGRAGSAVESRREPSRGRTKSAVAGGRGRMTAHESVLAERNSFGKHRGSYDLGVSDAHHFQARHEMVKAKLGPDAHRAYSAGHARVGAVDSSRSEAPRRESHISAEPMKDGRHKLTDAKSGESVKAVHLASFDSQGHTITGVRGGLMHTRDDSGKAHVYDPATGRAARSAATERAQQVAQDRTRRVEAARGEPKLADLSESDLRGLISRYGDRSVQADAARAEMLRRSGGSATVSHPSVTGQQVNPGDKVAFGKSGRDRWTVQRHLPAGKVHLQSEHLSSRGVGHGQATRTVDSSRLRHLSPPAETAPTGQSNEHPALSHEERQTLSREQESLARANAIDRRSGAGKAGRLDETIKARERRIREIKRTLRKGAK